MGLEWCEGLKQLVSVSKDKFLIFWDLDQAKEVDKIYLQD